MNAVVVEPEVARAPTDEEVVTRVLAGETAAFELIMRRHNRRLYRAARAILRDDAEAEDVMQDAYVRAYEHLAQFDGRARFSTWLTKIAVHEALARLRRRQRTQPLDPSSVAVSEEVPMSAEQPHDPETDASNQELAHIVEAALERLPEAFRVVFVLRAVEELSVAETSACLDLPEDTVKTRLFRARARIQKDLRRRMSSAVPEVYAFHLRRCDRVVAAVLARIAMLRGASV